VSLLVRRPTVGEAPPGGKPRNRDDGEDRRPAVERHRQAAWSVFRLAVSEEAPGGSAVARVLCRWICMDVFFLFLGSLVRDMLDWLRAGRFVTEL